MRNLRRGMLMLMASWTSIFPLQGMVNVCPDLSVNRILTKLRTSRKSGIGLAAVVFLLTGSTAYSVYFNQRQGIILSPLLEEEPETEGKNKEDPMVVWESAYYQKYLLEKYADLEKTFLIWTRSKSQTFFENLNAEERKVITLSEIVDEVGPKEEMPSVVDFLAVTKRYQLTSENADQANTFMNFKSYLVGPNNILSDVFQVFKFTGTVQPEPSPIIHFEVVLKLNPAGNFWRTYDLKLLFWLDESVPNTAIIHWIQVGDSEEYAYTRGFIKSFLDENHEISLHYFGSAFPHAAFRFDWTRKMGHNKLEKMGNEIVGVFKKQLGAESK